MNATSSTEPVRSVCPYCGVGCGILLQATGPQTIKVTGDKAHPSNFGRLCTKGSSCTQPLFDPDRLTQARIRADRQQAWQPTPMDAAIQATGQRLRQLLDQHGPDALSFYVSGQMSLESQYLINKLAKGYVRTNQIESNSRLCMASAGMGYKLSLGSDAPPGSYQDFDQADLFLVIGANMADCHPILFLRMMDRVKAGARLIVVDPRRTTTADKADLFLQIRPGTDLALLNGLLHLLVQNGHTDPEFITAFTQGWEAMPDLLADYPPERVAAITGLSEENIRQAAEWIGRAAEWMTCWTMGLNQSTHGTWSTNAICNLHLATGAICRPGSGPFSLTGQPNAMGGREMGYMGPGLPGQRSVLVAEDRAFTEAIWQLPAGTLRTDLGGGTLAQFEALATGQIKACWIICTNPVASVASRDKVIAGLQAAELVIVQDAFLITETNPYADILLPGALWAEAEGVMINSERNLTLTQAVVNPPGEALPDWQIIARVACAMGFSEGFSYTSAAEVFDEIRQFWNPQTGYDLRGASHERLRQTPLQWPCPPDAVQDRQPIRYLSDDTSQPRLKFATASGKAVFWPRPHLDPAEMPDDDFPLVLNTGRLQHQWHTLTKTGKVATLNKLNPGPFVEIHPEDAARLGIAEQDPVEIRSRRGQAALPAVITDQVLPGNCFVPFHWNDCFGEQLAINAVTSDAIDPISQQPEFKFAAVALTRLTAAAVSPAISSVAKPSSPPLAALEAFLGLEAQPPMQLTPTEQTYLQGFLAGLKLDDLQPWAGVPVLPATAPLGEEKRLLLDGLLAGLFARAPLPDGNPMAATAEGAGPLLILWASQTGKAEDFARHCSQQLQAAGQAVTLLGMDDCSLATLATTPRLLVLTSTFGDGDPPDNGQAFWSALQAETAPSLAGLQFSLLAFGDSSYDQFCGFGRQLDQRLQQLGAHCLLPRADCEPDHEATANSWLAAVLQALSSTPDTEISTTRAALPGIPLTDTSDQGYSRNQPCAVRLIGNRLLNAPGAGKETRQLVFDLTGTGLTYDAGDALGVWPVNDPQQVANMLQRLQLPEQEPVQLPDRPAMPLADALRYHRDITRITPEILQFISEQTGNPALAERLEPARKDELKTWLWGRQLNDLLQDFPLQVTAQEWLALLKPLQPRLYSIASSARALPDQVHLTVSTVRYRFEGQLRGGVCSTFLADRASEAPVSVFVQRSAHFRPPGNPDTAMIMVGPGTGIAPFRAFLQERQATAARGRNWLFFGEQHAATDFYYRDELEALQQAGYLHRLDVAFSRDQAEKVYVQQKMLEQAAELWAWLQQGAHFYVCGDASRMARDVDEALRQVVQTQGGMSHEAAADWVRQMAKDRRYVRDVY